MAKDVSRLPALAGSRIGANDPASYEQSAPSVSATEDCAPITK